MVYLLGIEEGKITPKRKVLDVPEIFGNYSPQNFDRTCAGLLTVEDALAQSLNIPAVSLLNSIGTRTFVKKLKELKKD